VTALASRDLGLRDAEDPEIFEAAKAQGVIFMTKDSDFVDLVDRLGAPPQIIWLTCGNTSNARLREILNSVLPEALELLRSGEKLVPTFRTSNWHIEYFNEAIGFPEVADRALSQ
jgi:predicted nuclease of predicted toxin-antitoxin system